MRHSIRIETDLLHFIQSTCRSVRRHSFRFVGSHACVVGSTKRLHTLPLVFYIYDCMLTMDREFDLFWNRRITGSSVLFFVNRYYTLLFSIAAQVKHGPFSIAVRIVHAGLSYFSDLFSQ